MRAPLRGSSRTAAILVLLVACDETRRLGPTLVAPLDGETAVDAHTPLLVRTGGLEIPPEYPFPELIRVIDEERAGFVEGDLVLERGDLWFHPDGGWLEDTRYVWRIRDPFEVPRGPEIRLGGALVGEVFFDTDPATRVLDAVIDPDEARIGLVFSTRVGDLGNMRITVDDLPQPQVATEVRSERELHDLPLPAGDDGVDVVFLHELPAVAPGASLRVWLDVGPSRQFILEGRRVVEVLRERRREAR